MITLCSARIERLFHNPIKKKRTEVQSTRTTNQHRFYAARTCPHVPSKGSFDCMRLGGKKAKKAKQLAEPYW